MMVIVPFALFLTIAFAQLVTTFRPVKYASGKFIAGF